MKERTRFLLHSEYQSKTESFCKHLIYGAFIARQETFLVSCICFASSLCSVTPGQRLLQIFFLFCRRLSSKLLHSDQNRYNECLGRMVNLTNSNLATESLKAQIRSTESSPFTTTLRSRKSISPRAIMRASQVYTPSSDFLIPLICRWLLSKVLNRTVKAEKNDLQ